MRYLLAEELLAIHDRLLGETGGLAGIRDLNLLFSIAERPKSGMLGQEFYPDVFTKAAAYLEGLATYHVFTDGNKRTAITAASVFLRVNGFIFQASGDAAYRYVLTVAKKEKTLKRITEWLKKHSKKSV